MNKRIDLSNLGGFPMTQFTLSEMQDSYRGALAAMAKLVGSKTILYGVEVAGGTVSDGWIAYNGELIPFIGGSVNTKVVITETPVSRTFEDTAVYDVYFTKTATCASLGDFNFSELVTLLPFSNVWLPGDLKQKYVDNAYIAANYDVDGYGLNQEKGWRILSSAVPAAAGKVLVNRDAGDADFDVCGDTGGAKTYTIARNELPAVNILNIANQTTVASGGFGMLKKSVSGANVTPSSTDATGSGSEIDIVNIAPFPNLGTGTPVANNNLQPYFVVLTLIKL